MATNPRLGQADVALSKVAERRGESAAFHPTDVGIYRGKPGETAPDSGADWDALRFIGAFNAVIAREVNAARVATAGFSPSSGVGHLERWNTLSLGGPLAEISTSACAQDMAFVRH